MATQLREIEWKYDAAPGASLPDLTGLPQVENQSEPDELLLEATYYDTAQLDLARSAITLRRRLGGDDAGWHLKLPDGPGARTELQLPVADELPDEFTELLTARLRGRPVQPVARISTTRQRRRLRDQTGAILAEVVLDRVTAEPLIGDPAVALRWSEVEVELGEAGGPQLLKAADRQLRRNGLRRSGRESKLATVLADRMPAPAAEPAPTAASSAGEVVLAYLRTQVEQLIACDAMVRRDLSDSVHQMRVAMRRLRSALRTFGALLPQEIEPLAAELRWLGEVLGRSRDDEVLREHLTDNLAAVPVELILGPVLGRITGHFAPRQAEARRLLLEALASERYLALLDGLDRLIAAPLTPDAGGRAADVLPPLVWRAFRRTRRRMAAANTAVAGEPRNVALHEARKAAKRARYAAEAAAAVMGKQASRTAKALKEVQTTLGDHQDTVIAREALRRLAVGAHAAGESEFTYGLLYARQSERAAMTREQAADAWHRVNRHRNLTWMR